LPDLVNMVVDIVLATVGISLLITVHELGHFIMAKVVGLRVEVFSIGFWKRIVGFRVGETDYRLSLVPLGGYVKVAGESPQEGSGAKDEFWSKTPGQRALFVCGGVVMNFLLALALFAVAFWVGVPFEVAHVGSVERGSPAWRAGVMQGDRILRMSVNGESVGYGGRDSRTLTFLDVGRAVMLSKRGDVVRLVLARGDQTLSVALKPVYDEAGGFRRMGLNPLFEPIVTGFAELKDGDRGCPAREAGIELGDRIVAVGGVAVDSFREVRDQLAVHRGGPISVDVERVGKDGHKRVLQFRITPLQVSVPRVGISGASSVVESVQAGGPAAVLGLRPGDRVVAVGDTPIASSVALSEALASATGRLVTLHVERDGGRVEMPLALGGALELQRFLFSVDFEVDATLDWVRQGSPAWEAGMRPGDTIRYVDGVEVASWEDVIELGSRAGERAREFVWARDGEDFSAEI